MSIVDGVAYGEPFETAAAALRLEGSGVRIDSIQIANTGGRATGAAYVGFNGTYSFNLDGRRIPVEQVALASSGTAPPLSGLFDFTAGGSGTFDEPRYDVRGTISDLFVGDEGIGQVLGQLSVNGDLMTVKVEAASPRLAVSGSGRIALTPGMEAELLFSVADTSLDPYVRVFRPSPLSIHHRDRQWEPPRDGAAGRHRPAPGGTRPSIGSTCGCSTTDSGIPCRSASRWIATRCGSRT